MVCNKPVDRSYHPYKAIRDYQDRGMVKWMGFYLSEHTSAMKKWKYEENSFVSDDPLDKETKLLLLSQSFTTHNPISIIFHFQKIEQLNNVIVQDLISDNECLFKLPDKSLKRIYIKDILQIIEKE